MYSHLKEVSCIWGKKLRTKENILYTWHLLCVIWWFDPKEGVSQTTITVSDKIRYTLWGDRWVWTPSSVLALTLWKHHLRWRSCPTRLLRWMASPSLCSTRSTHCHQWSSVSWLLLAVLHLTTEYITWTKIWTLYKYFTSFDRICYLFSSHEIKNLKNEI